MLILTPECFVEVCVLGLYWEHWPAKVVHRVLKDGATTSYLSVGFSTVDHILKVFNRMEAINQDHMKMVHNSAAHQRKLYRHCAVRYGSEYTSNKDTWLLCQTGLAQSRGVDLRKLVRNQRISIQPKGVELAPSFEGKHAAQITKEVFLQKSFELREEFSSDAGRIAAVRRYNAKVETELGEESN